jgi:hypothetical protein
LNVCGRPAYRLENYRAVEKFSESLGLMKTHRSSITSGCCLRNAVDKPINSLIM